MPNNPLEATRLERWATERACEIDKSSDGPNVT